MEYVCVDVTFRTNKLKSICTDYSIAIREHGQDMAVLIHQRIDQIRSADSIDQLIMYKIGRCHRLKGSKKEQFAMDLIHPFRLILARENTVVSCARIEAIEDYH